MWLWDIIVALSNFLKYFKDYTYQDILLYVFGVIFWIYIIILLFKTFKKSRIRKFKISLLKNLENKRFFQDYVKEAFFYSKENYLFEGIEYQKMFFVIKAIDLVNNKRINVFIDLLDEDYEDFFYELNRLYSYEVEDYDKMERLKELEEVEIWNGFKARKIIPIENGNNSADELLLNIKEEDIDYPPFFKKEDK